jgi:hypothetical protein
MPVFLAALIGGLVSAVGSITGRVLVALGIGFVAFTGIDTGLGELKALVVNSGNALPAQIIGMLGVLKVGTCINILFSALTARLVIQGLTSGTLKRMVVK